MMKFKQLQHPIELKEIDKSSNIIFLVKPNEHFNDDTPLPYREVIKKRLQRYDIKDLSKTNLVCDLPNEIGTRITVTSAKPADSTFEYLTQARKAIKKHLNTQPKTLCIVTVGLDKNTERSYVEAFVAAILAASFKLPDYKSSTEETNPLKQINFYGLSQKHNLQYVQAIANGNNLARQLTFEPSNKLTPASYLKKVKKLAQQYQWKIDFIDIKALKQKQAGAFLAVAQGSDNNEAGVIHLRYEARTNKKHATKKLALVGKGICYDTGGTNLKPSKSMYGMHEDMEGSAVALGTLVALSELEVPFPVDCWLAVTNNMIGPLAYKQNDVITALNGTTIEVVHTDAEGRMVLADTLSLACETHPSLIIDYATLTGSCVAALGTRYSGVMTNRFELINELIAAGRQSGERVWPFPTDEDYDEELESQIADVKQCTLGNEADHILGARFLVKFVNNIPWVHLDLSSGSHKGGLAHIPSDITGMGVSYTINLLLNQKLLQKV